MDHTSVVALALEVELAQAREFARAESVAKRVFNERAGTDLLDLRSMLNGLMAMLSFHLRTPIAVTNKIISYQLALACSFNRTQLLVYRSLSEGNVPEGATLLRRQIEVLSRIIELQSVPLEKLKARTPNISVLLTGATGRIYGELSQAAHFADPNEMDLLLVSTMGDRTGPSPYPIHHERALAYLEVSLYLAIVFSSWLHEMISIWYPSIYLADETMLGAIAVKLASDLGIFQKGNKAVI